MEVQKGKEECEAKIRKFYRILRMYEPSAMNPSILMAMKNYYFDKVHTALDEMIDSIEKLSIKHKQELGSHEVTSWKQKITDGEREFTSFLNKVGRKLDSHQSKAPAESRSRGDGQGSLDGQSFRRGQMGGGDDSKKNPGMGFSYQRDVALGMKASRMIPKTAMVFRPSQPDEKCRVCNTLVGLAMCDTKDLYDNHNNSVAVGCPRFATMTMETRRDIVKKAQLCDYCLDQNAVVKPGTLHARCPVLTQKRFYSCLEEGCKTHYWLCDSPDHILMNKKKAELSKKHWNNRGITFVHLAHFFRVELGGVVGGVVAESSKPESDAFDEDDVPMLNKIIANINKKPVEEARVSLKDATEKLKEVAKGSTVLEVPEGEPLFLFSSAVGKTRPINIFYDDGCSHVVLKTGIPERELNSVKTKKGPLNIGGVGNSTIIAKDEWACLLERTDGSKQVIQGVTMDHITSPFPMINVSQAVKEVKADDPNNKELQEMKVPVMAGGEADVLLGILYQNCHPVIVHTLPCGLFIAKLKLASPNGEWTGVIGGPHRSFDMFANHVGDATRLMANFVDGLRDFQTLGAPKIHGPMMTWEDVNFAQRMSKAEIEDFTHQVMDTYGENEDTMKKSDDKVAEFFSSTILCNSCGTDLIEDDVLEEIKEATLSAAAKLNKGAALVSESDDHQVKPVPAPVATSALYSKDDEKLSELKNLVRLQELGLSIDYRCPSCRSCASCKNAPSTERLSMREEAEDQAMRDAVKIDFKKKKVTCTMPLRGKPEEFLSNNREVALKVLDSQCKKVQDDEEAKAAVIKSFYKLFDGGYAKRLEELTDEQQNLILSQPVQNYLPWRVVHKQSISTPCRTVMDASSKTPLKPNGQGGRCLNDLTMKGKVNTLDLLNMLLRFSIGHVAFTGDLKQFYTSIALNPSQWNLQRVLWREGLAFESKIEEIVILSLIFGVRCVSALSEKAIIMLAEYVRPRNPRLAELLLGGRFVDDLGDSDETLEKVQNLLKAADELFESVGWSVKGYSVSGSNPHPDVTADGVSVDVGGMTWYPLIDCVAVKIPPLHFGKKSRGKLVVGTEVFDGTFEDLKKFVPKKLTRRQIISKFSAVFDMYGKLEPVRAKMKLDARSATEETDEWDGEVTQGLRDRWCDNFWRLQKLKGLKFQRARVPVDAVDTNLYLVGCVDAAAQLKIAGVWARFKRKNGEYSSQLVIGRSLLSRKDGTIPKEELEAMTMGSNLLWICRRALEGWLKDYMLCGDSVIAICWVTSEKKRLSLFHRNRVVQIRFHTEMDKIFHLRTEHNPADIGTRPDNVKETDVGPESPWERGLEWMRHDLEDAFEADILKHAKELRLNTDEEKEYDRGLVFEKCPEILVRGHSAFATNIRVEKMATRAEFSKYVFMPTKFSFRKVLRVTATILKYMKNLNPRMQSEKTQKFKMFVAEKSEEKVINVEKSLVEHFVENDQFMGICWGSEKPLSNIKGDVQVDLEDEDIARALEYWYKKGSAEVQEFNKKELVSRISVEKHGILYCRSRIMDGQRFISAGGFDKKGLGMEVQLDMMTPMLDRHSPIAYSIANFVHHEVGKHAGYETSYRLSLGYCHIMQGAGLFREIGEECSKCAMIRKKYIEVVMGPVSDFQLTISPPFHAAFCDLDGPYNIFVPGHERVTRNKAILSAKAWIMTFACPVTKMLNLQVIETKSADGVIEGLSRLGCEQGFPKYLLLDQESSFMKTVRDAEISLKDLQLLSYKEHGIRCEVAPVSGHNFTGLVERKIRTVQQVFEKIGFKNTRVHATGLQTIAKLVENDLNNLPLGFSYGRSSDNTPLLKLLTPNMMKIGRLNSRALSGPIRFPTGPKDVMRKVEEVYDAFYKIWNVAMVPRLIPQPKWFKDSPELEPEDVVWFQKTESELSSDWTVGQVDSVTRSKDSVVRRAWVRYYNHTENKPRYTDRAARSLVRLFNIEDNYFVNDMAAVEAMIFELENERKVSPKKLMKDGAGKYKLAGSPTASLASELSRKVDPLKLVKVSDDEYEVKNTTGSRAACESCCCASHCVLSDHAQTGVLSGVSMATKVTVVNKEEYEFPHIYERVLLDEPEYPEPMRSSLIADSRDEIFDMLTALETDFGLKVVKEDDLLPGF